MDTPILEGEIGFDITISSLVGLQSFMINSPGGSLFEGLAMYDLVNGSDIEVGVIGVCASAATLPLLASEKRWGTPNSRYLIHNPWDMAIGDAASMSKTANELKAEQDRALDLYMAKLKGTRDEIQSIMNAEKILTAPEALELGLITEIRSINKTTEPTPEGSDIKNMFNQFKMYYDMTNKDDVKKELTGIRAMLEGLSKLLNPPKNIMIQDVNGKELDFGDSASTADEIKVGSTATVDGSPAEGEFVINTGETYVFEGGELKEIKPAQDDNAEMEALKTENAALKEQIQNLESEKLSIQNKMDTVKNEMDKVNARFETISKQFNFSKAPVNTPPVAPQNNGNQKFGFKPKN